MQIVVSRTDGRVWSPKCVIAPVVLIPVTVLSVQLPIEIGIVHMKLIKAYSDNWA